MRIQKVSISWYSLVASSGLIVLLAILMLCPIVPEGANATEGNSAGNDGAGVPAVQADVVTEPSISMALSARTESDVTPTASGTFQASTAKLQVAVSLPSNYKAEGYKVYLKSNTNDNKLKGTGTNSTAINPVSSNTNKVNFGKNTWGYSLYKTGSATTDTAIYQPVPISSTIVDNSTDLTGTYDLAFATKIDTSIPADQYSNSVLVSVVAEPKMVTTLSAITNMQEMTTQICTDSAENETKQLIDTRDNKSYWVAKLKDGNCWMTQNLALDITTAGLKASDTDIARDWTATQSADPSVTTVYPPKATEYAVPTSVSDDHTHHDTLSWNLGRYQLADPTSRKRCGFDITNITTCVNNGVLTSTITDEHYTLGNFYEWETAVAGTGYNLRNVDAKGSICPKGRQLPSGGDKPSNPSTDKKTITRLLSEYFAMSSNSTSSFEYFEQITGDYDIIEEPLYFVPGGELLVDSSWQHRFGLNDAGKGGGYWLSTGNAGSVSPYYSCFYNNDFQSSSSSGSMDDGYFVRCVAR